MSAPCAPRAVNFSETTTFALDVAREAADLVMRVLPESPTAKQVAHKGPTDLVTRADRESEQLITARIRERFPDTPLMVDANSAYRLEDLALFQELDQFHLMMIEQPLGYDDLWDHAKLQRQIRTPICLDESVQSPDDARKALEMGACRIINIKAGRVGGLARSQAIHDVAAAHGAPVWCGGMLESGIGRAHNVHLSTLANFSLPGDVADSRRYFKEDVIEPPVEVRPDGTIAVPSEPGIGYRVLEDRIRQRSLHSVVLKRR